MTSFVAFVKQRNDDFFRRQGTLVLVQTKYAEIRDLAAEFTEQ